MQHMDRKGFQSEFYEVLITLALGPSSNVLVLDVSSISRLRELFRFTLLSTNTVAMILAKPFLILWDAWRINFTAGEI